MRADVQDTTPTCSCRFAGANVLRSVYGWPSITPAMVPAIERIRELTARLARAAMPGAFLVEVIPMMKYLPSWLARWKREGLEWSRRYAEMLEGHNADVATRLVSSVRIEHRWSAASDLPKHAGDGDAQDSLVGRIIEGESRYELSKTESAWLAGTML